MGETNLTIDAWLIRLAAKEEGFAAAGWTALTSARSCDEHGRPEDADVYRRRAIEFWRIAERAGEEITGHGLAAAQLAFADTLRRLDRFEEAGACCHRGLSGRPADPLRSLLEFEIELIAGHDTDAHRVDEVICRR